MTEIKKLKIGDNLASRDVLREKHLKAMVDRQNERTEIEEQKSIADLEVKTPNSDMDVKTPSKDGWDELANKGVKITSTGTGATTSPIYTSLIKMAGEYNRIVRESKETINVEHFQHSIDRFAFRDVHFGQHEKLDFLHKLAHHGDLNPYCKKYVEEAHAILKKR